MRRRLLLAGSLLLVGAAGVGLGWALARTPPATSARNPGVVRLLSPLPDRAGLVMEAVERDVFAQIGVPVALTLLDASPHSAGPPSQEVLRLLASGEYDGACLDAGRWLRALASGVPLEAVARVGRTPERVLVLRPGLATPEGGVLGTGVLDSDELLAERALEELGIRLVDGRIQIKKGETQRALASGLGESFDAVVLDADVARGVRGTILEAPDVADSDLLLALRSEFVARHPERALQLVRALVQVAPQPEDLLLDPTRLEPLRGWLETVGHPLPMLRMEGAVRNDLVGRSLPRESRRDPER